MSDFATSQKRCLKIGTRKSPLALWQAEHVAALLADLGVETELVPLVSSGDVDMSPIDGKRQVGVFTKRIQQALVDDEADVAVHSMKDLPTEVDDRFVLAAVPSREVVHDCLVSPAAWTISDLPQNARIGTGSRRRAAQLLNQRPDLSVLPIRGNVQTRLAKLEAGEFDAIMLANAGLLRLEMQDLSRCVLPLEEMLPAPGQGALAIEVRCDDPYAIETLSKIDDVQARTCVTAERTLLSNLNGGCLAPIAAHATIAPSAEGDDVVSMTAIVLAPDGTQSLSESGSVVISEAQDGPSQAIELATLLSKSLADRGAAKLIAAAR